MRLTVAILSLGIAGMAIRVMMLKIGCFAESGIGHNDTMKRKHLLHLDIGYGVLVEKR